MIFPYSVITAKIKKLRSDSGFSQEKVAERAGMDRSHYTKIELGKIIPEDETLLKIIKAFNFDYDEAKDILAKWRIEDELKKASNPSKVIDSIVAGDHSIVITGNNNNIAK